MSGVQKELHLIEHFIYLDTSNIYNDIYKEHLKNNHTYL